MRLPMRITASAGGMTTEGSGIGAAPSGFSDDCAEASAFAVTELGSVRKAGRGLNKSAGLSGGSFGATSERRTTVGPRVVFEALDDGVFSLCVFDCTVGVGAEYGTEILD